MARLAALWMCEDISTEILPIPQWTFTYFSKVVNTQTRCKICSNLTKCTATIDFCLTSFSFINLEHLSHPTLVLLFILWKGKCWLKVCREIFVKIIQSCYHTLEFRPYGTPHLLIFFFFCHLPKLIQHSPFINFGQFCQPFLLFQTPRLLIHVHSRQW